MLPGRTGRELQGTFYNELSDMNDLTKAFHHDDGGGGEDDIELDDAAVTPIVRHALEVIGATF